jgi:hypothetical protein
MGEGGGDGRPLPLIISTGEAEANRQFFAEYKVSWPVLLQTEMEISTPYHASGTPSGYLIDAGGKIASELAVGAETLLALAEGRQKVENRKQKLNRGFWDQPMGTTIGMVPQAGSATARWHGVRSNGTD